MIEIRVQQGASEYVVGYMAEDLYDVMWPALEIWAHQEGYDALLESVIEDKDKAIFDFKIFLKREVK